jgi:hypothetical protein
MSPYFPPDRPLVPYQCEGCGDWYVMPRVALACCVLHPPGSCCHFGEIAVASPGETAPPTTEPA